MNSKAAYEVYIDFDNTITTVDVLDEIIQNFSIDDEWREVEQQWTDGIIGSRECLERQLAKVRIEAGELDAYLSSVHIDPGYIELVQDLRSRSVEAMILSDSFTYFINRILEANYAPVLPIRANEISHMGNQLLPHFPFANAICSTAANCKTSHLLKRDRASGTQKIYIGDGRSDICPAQFCEILFAKDSLYRYYAEVRPRLFQFETLSNVQNQLRLILQ